MPDRELTPKGSSTPSLTIPAGASIRENRQQTQLAGRFGTKDGGPPAVEVTGLKPGQFEIRGEFRGSSAESLANTLRTDFLDDRTVEKVDLATPGGSSPEDGTYTLDDGDVRRVHTITDNWWKFAIRLTEE